MSCEYLGIARRWLTLATVASVLIGATYAADPPAAEDKTANPLRLPSTPAATEPAPLYPVTPEPGVMESGTAEADSCWPVDAAGTGPGAYAFSQVFDGCGCCRDTRVYRSEILGRLWVKGEYLAWATKGERFPPLVTTSPQGTAPSDTGVLDRGDTGVLFGGEEMFDEMRSGFRLTGGYWWTPAQFGGIEANYFELEEREVRTYTSATHPRLARPYFDVPSGQQASRLVAYPGVIDGAISVAAGSTFNGAEVLLRQSVSAGLLHRVYVVSGYRYARLHDWLETSEGLLSLDPASGYAAGTALGRWDRFETINDFHGGELGLVGRWWRNRFSFQATGKVALGATFSDTNIDGATLLTENVGGNTVATGYRRGLLALASNSGLYHNNDFASMEELAFSLDYALTCNLRLSLGYNLTYWSLVGRAADQIDAGLNPSQFPPGTLVGAARPEFHFQSTSYWAQGLTLGLEYQF